MKVTDLTGSKLDYWVARAEGLTCKGRWWCRDGEEWCTVEHFAPSMRWEVGGPIIEREQINIQFGGWDEGAWRGYSYVWEPGDAFGETPLIAAMRVYVASKFGGDVSEELDGEADGAGDSIA